MNQAAALIALLAVAWPTAASTVEDPAVQQLATVSIFLATHQEADGRWDDRGEAAQPEAGVAPAAAVLTTGLAIQVQLHSGQRDSAQRGLAWLKRQQGADGSIGDTNAEQAIATRAFLEGWFAGDETCEAPARHGLEQLAQRRIRPYCWPEKPGEAEVIDVETSFWCQQAARAVADRREAGAASMLIAAAWRERNSGPIATPQTNGGRILHPTTFPARFVSGPQGGLAIDYTAGEAPAAGLFLLGQSGDWGTDDAPFSLANRVASDLAVEEGVAPNWRQRCIARTALGSFRYPPLPQPDRTQWERLLAQGFRAAGPHAGSWDPHADRPADGGRITTTCFAALTAWRSGIPPAPASRVDGALSFLKRAQESDGRWSQGKRITPRVTPARRCGRAVP